MFGPQNDPGSSFVTLLRRVGIEPFGVGDATSGVAPLTPHATTVLALRFDGGVVMAGDRRATMGNRISNREMEKLMPADRFSGVAISGSAGPAMDMIKVFQLQLEHFEKLDGRAISLEGKANQLSQLVRANLPAAMQGFGVYPIFAGYDLLRETGRLWDFDGTGGRYEERDFVATGSGGGVAGTVLKVGFRPAMPVEEAVTLACRALHEAADVDAATGGADALRGIYPVVATITKDGWMRRADDDLAPRFEAFRTEQRAILEGGAS
ncbi:MAG: proteasome beta-type subunit [Actinomycetota bacterium]|jgi:proteasome beta subunit